MGVKEKKGIAIAFAILLLIGLLAVRGYGIGVDENTEVDIARMDIKEYVRLLCKEDSSLFQYMDSLIGDLMDSVEIDHGEAVLYPAVALVSVLRAVGRTDIGMYVYHIYIYILFLLGLLALYGIGKFLTGKRRWGICAAAFVWLNPLLFGQSFVNNKDVVMMSLVSVCIYSGIRFVQEKNWKWSVLWGISIAFCVNMRIIGLEYLGLFGLLYLLEFFQKEHRNKKVFINGAIAVVSSIAAFILITPATWYSLMGYFEYTLSNTVSFSRLNIWVLYFGELYNFVERPLPWHYFLGYIAVTTPVGILLALVIGQIGSLKMIVEKRTEWIKKKYIIVLLLSIWVPMFYFIVRGANVYGGWRHYYFIYPELALLAVCVLDWLCGIFYKKEKLIWGVLMVQGVICVGLLVVGHPFQTSYHNCLAKRPVAREFEYAGTEYYKEALEQILAVDGSDSILVSSEDYNCYYGIKQAWEILHPDKKARIQIAEPETAGCEEAKYHIYSESSLQKERLMYENGLRDLPPYKPEEKFNSQLVFEAYGYRIITVYYNK